jgi:DNA-binding transcriptional MerR regulator
MIQASQMSRKVYTTVQVANAANVPRATLQFWIASGKISAPEVRLIEGVAARLWTEADVERIRKFKGTLKPGTKSSKKKK